MKIKDKLQGVVVPPIFKKLKDKKIEVVDVIEKETGNEYFDVDPIWNIRPEPDIRMIHNGRRDGKTYNVLLKIIREIVYPYNKTVVYIRRYKESVSGVNIEELFTKMVLNGHITEATEGAWNNVKYYGKKFTFCKMDEEGKVTTDDHFFCKTCALDVPIEKNKGNGFGDVGAIVFDEYMAFEEDYLYNELYKYKNLIVTICDGKKIPIFFLGNTVDANCPYFSHFGLFNAGRKQQQGTIDVYHQKRKNGKNYIIAVDYSYPSEQSKRNADLVAFDEDSESSNMMHSGKFEDGEYELLPFKYPQRCVRFKFYIEYNEHVVQCNVVNYDKMLFLYCHRKEFPVYDRDHDIIYTTYYDPRPNIRQEMSGTGDNLDIMLYGYFRNGQVYYQDNSVGRIVRDYFKYCKQKRRASF